MNTTAKTLIATGILSVAFTTVCVSAALFRAGIMHDIDAAEQCIETRAREISTYLARLRVDTIREYNAADHESAQQLAALRQEVTDLRAELADTRAEISQRKAETNRHYLDTIKAIEVDAGKIETAYRGKLQAIADNATRAAELSVNDRLNKQLQRSRD